LLGHIGRLARCAGITVCVNRRESDIPIHLPAGADLIPVEIRREISPVHDLLALLRLRGIYREERFALVLSVTPKGGLLGMLAAKLAGVPVRVHWFTGQVWVTKRGLGRLILKTVDRLIAGCATHVLADSPSQRDFLVAERVVRSRDIHVLGDGSISGVDPGRFRPDSGQREKVRFDFGIPAESPCLLYVGRMKREKGIPDLLAAFAALRAEFSDLHLILVGPDEEGLLVGLSDPNIHIVGYAKDVEKYMAAADIFCLPSYREGFGSVLIEAAAAGLPAVASRIYGITDAVVDGETGLLHRAGDSSDLARCLAILLRDPATRQKMVLAGRSRALDDFSSERVEGLLVEYLLKTAKTKNVRLG